MSRRAWATYAIVVAIVAMAMFTAAGILASITLGIYGTVCVVLATAGAAIWKSKTIRGYD